ncbi:MAG: ATP-binding protein [Bacteroidia bacterium]|nr:ATP-binding protein [Bacteroidia bacterium]
MGTKTQNFDFQRIFDSQPEPSALLCCEGDIVYVNQALSDLLGVESVEMEGAYFSSILREPFSRESFSFFKSRFKKDGIYDPLSVFLAGDHEAEWTMRLFYLKSESMFLVNFYPGKELQSDHSKNSSSLDKISLELEKKELQKKKQEIDHLIYIIGHDLRAPMRAILGFSQILKDDYKDKIDGHGLELIDIVQNNTRKLNSLVSNLIEYSRLTKREELVVAIDLRELFEHEFRKQFEGLEEPREMTFQIGEMGTIRADAKLIKIISTELLSNAIKFSREVEEPLIEVGGYVDVHGYTFYIKDNGIGFDMASGDRVFGIFEKLVLEEDYPGNGIGLARVNKAVKLMGGRIWPEAHPGEGAAFYVFIPQT